ncbi:MAG: homoserine kinase [Chloroflexi bacterium]|nr:homoserine kinase [Chloroflexota bacterium]
MGPGFDCLGMALDIWNTVEVRVGPPGFEITGHGHDSLPQDTTNLVHQSIIRVFRELDRPVPDFHLICHNEIPLTRGMGSSSAALVGGLVAANALCDGAISGDDLLQIAVEIEGHPDNVTPALLGGFQIAVNHQGRVIAAPVPIPQNLAAVLFVPDLSMPTDEARDILKPEISRADAVYNIGRAALLVHAFATGDLTRLGAATDDRLHQPQRQSIFFPMKNLFRAAMDAGALGVFLSGAGSSVLALTRDREYTIGYEMADAAAKSGLDGEIIVTRPTQQGAHVVEIS